MSTILVMIREAAETLATEEEYERTAALRERYVRETSVVIHSARVDGIITLV
ncbi:hypothetical protein C8250_038835 [Streptomyces sp. So13.3]|uniref:hypothetical protein n=1 Tax=Streptomyces TaxID=1883 RepID=UPI00164DA7EF|nr:MULTISPECIES: hypothetical protein [Streptomyces]MCZ4103800.1 hypothetical protein [Streptomyces sp. H39-C1]QNA77032.1 hypothetical protein C8250_038835 [Streptomyces sp. So13.3]